MENNPELKTSEYLKGIVLNLPESPGIYQYLNTEGVIIYVGKAKNLKRRVSSYFNKEHEPGKNKSARQQDSRYTLYRCKYRGGCIVVRKQSNQKIQTTIQRFIEG